MVRRLLASVFLAAFPVVVIPIAVTSMGARAGAAPPAAVQQCMRWRLADFYRPLRVSRSRIRASASAYVDPPSRQLLPTLPAHP